MNRTGLEILTLAITEQAKEMLRGSGLYVFAYKEASESQEKKLREVSQEIVAVVKRKLEEGGNN